MKRDITLEKDGSREYDPTPGRPKHRWKKNYAGFKKQGGHRIGKCPQDLTLSVAKRLLQNAVADVASPFDSTPYPKNLYAVYRGVIYRAVGGERTNVYHGFPCDRINNLDATVYQKLEQQAIQEGTLKNFKRWVRDYA